MPGDLITEKRQAEVLRRDACDVERHRHVSEPVSVSGLLRLGAGPNYFDLKKSVDGVG
jgi:hypothetical protein